MLSFFDAKKRKWLFDMYICIWLRKFSLKIMFLFCWRGKSYKNHKILFLILIKIGIRNSLKKVDFLTPQLVSRPLLCNLLPLSMLYCNVMLSTIASHIIVQLNSLCSPHNFGKYIWSIAIEQPTIHLDWPPKFL